MTSHAKPLLSVENSSDQIRIFRSGAVEPILVQQAEANSRPFIHPILAPDGKGILTEDAPAHHPWQHGLYIGLNDVNGIGFWSEGLNPTRIHLDGTFHPRLTQDAQVKDNCAIWSVRTEYRHPQGQPLLQETQSWELTDLGDHYQLHLNWQLQAEIDLTFGEYPYGGLFLRMPFRHPSGGTALNSAGQRNAEAEGKRARWVAVQMPIQGRDNDAGIAIMDHPSNLEHPVPWRVDGQLGISPSCSIAGPWRLNHGEIRSFQYSVIIFTGQIQESFIEETWQSFARRE
ncbi:MAG: hypothetical protein K0R67_4034 [Paenibacillus sp.]|nr:hypothetical protein [Paenibacillus sp.]